jgi:hypothetical protein
VLAIYQVLAKKVTLAHLVEGHSIAVVIYLWVDKMEYISRSTLFSVTYLIIYSLSPMHVYRYDEPERIVSLIIFQSA